MNNVIITEDLRSGMKYHWIYANKLMILSNKVKANINS